MYRQGLLIVALLFFAGCATSAPLPVIPVSKDSVEAGSAITRSGAPAQLIGEPLRVGDALPDLTLLDSNLQQVRLMDLQGSILLLNFLPSVDTGVCERQTRILADLTSNLPMGVLAIVVSRDLPFAQARIRDQLGAQKVLFLSDYAEASFGRSTGLLIKELMLLGRGVMVVDQSGIVRYIQVVPEVAHLPDLDRAASFAAGLAAR
jgi:thiol peroxidase